MAVWMYNGHVSALLPFPPQVLPGECSKLGASGCFACAAPPAGSLFASKALPPVSPAHVFCIMHSLHCINNSKRTSRFAQAFGTAAPVLYLTEHPGHSLDHTFFQ